MAWRRLATSRYLNLCIYATLGRDDLTDYNNTLHQKYFQWLIVNTQIYIPNILHTVRDLLFCCVFIQVEFIYTLQDYLTDTRTWRHNDHNGVSHHQPHGCLLNRVFRHTSKKTPKLRVTGLCARNSPGPVNSPHKRPVTRKMFPFDDVIMVPMQWNKPGWYG